MKRIRHIRRKKQYKKVKGKLIENCHECPKFLKCKFWKPIDKEGRLVFKKLEISKVFLSECKYSYEK